ncbi:XylR family transcriptional regulator [Rubripirellula reticaptiva]|uniref:XylR family transcriptional regulator n=1 Tax=Rubripirellula reticaptiva TaxID=2528013 RepID=UPI001FE5B94B|nr:XylR family transcriptional regulator [Rubripirellula reticaptiva]
MRPDIPHVAILIETSRSYGRALLRGVRRYITETGPWSVFMELRSLDSPTPPWLKHWKGDGILTRTSNQAMATAISRTNVPTVELRSTRLRHAFPFVGVNNFRVGRMIADHFLDRGFQHFGLFMIETELYFQQRRDDFIETLRQRGHDCHLYKPTGRREQPAQWERAQDELAIWLTSLPKPVGIMASTDQMGFWILDASRRAGLSVPEQIAVVGVENDESLCTMAMPPLSSVPLNGERVGYQAATLLQRMMNGEKPPTEPTLIDPLPLVARQSSDVIAVDNADLSRALQLIKQKACNGLRVSDVLADVNISRSKLEREFRSTIGRSPNQEILRVKLDRVSQMLILTELTLPQIAAQTGFESVAYLSESFKQHFGSAPGKYRRQSNEGR